MSLTKNKCGGCGACKRVFVEWNCGYYKFSRDCYCMALNKLVDENDVCGQWRKRTAHYDLSVQRFDDVIRDIELIAQYIGDEQGND